ncbi:MAG TPA: preprotein translocase subunit SecE [Guyparkeria sp.]|nr:preprotein translocase subunit SecE [Guyparkeria sp.]HZJ81712.1 preprotein translocase subunit SecE [Guyparkeria sp.]
MSEKSVQPASSGLDSIKIAVAIGLILAGVVGYYLLDGQPLFVRILAVVAAAGLAIAVAYTTAVGRSIWQFSFDSRLEVKKMVWPTRQEATQTTLVVILLVFLIGLFLWGVDSLLGWIVRSITG